MDGQLLRLVRFYVAPEDIANDFTLTADNVRGQLDQLGRAVKTPTGVTPYLYR
jgi:hypothetical protein